MIKINKLYREIDSDDDHHRERTNPEDHIVEANKMVCDVPNLAEMSRECQKCHSATCARCDFPSQNEENTRRLYCMCGH